MLIKIWRKTQDSKKKNTFLIYFFFSEMTVMIGKSRCCILNKHNSKSTILFILAPFLPLVLLVLFIKSFLTLRFSNKYIFQTFSFVKLLKTFFHIWNVFRLILCYTSFLIWHRCLHYLLPSFKKLLSSLRMREDCRQ